MMVSPAGSVRVGPALAAMLFALLAGPPSAITAEPRKLAVCSTTQVADITRQVAGDRWEVRSVLAPGQDPHLYELKPGDAALAARADLCLENGWHLEGHDWMRSLAESAGKPLVTCVTGVTPLELEADGEKVRDPHAWFSPLNAAVYTRNIERGLAEVDPTHRLEYQARAELYLDQLRVLHLWITRQLNALPPERRVLVTGHDAFGYFCKQYGFRARSPVGWSTGAEIGGGLSAARRQQVVDSIRSYGVKAIFVETSVNPRMIEQIAADAGVRVGGELYSDSMGPPGSGGETYLGMMRENVLRIVTELK